MADCTEDKGLKIRLTRLHSTVLSMHLLTYVIAELFICLNNALHTFTMFISTLKVQVLCIIDLHVHKPLTQDK